MVHQTLPPSVHERGRQRAPEGVGRQSMRPLYAVSALTAALLYYALSAQTALTPVAIVLVSVIAAPVVFLLLRPLARRLPELEDAPRED